MGLTRMASKVVRTVEEIGAVGKEQFPTVCHAASQMRPCSLSGRASSVFGYCQFSPSNPGSITAKLGIPDRLVMS
jgi:hypothetical protein